MKTTRYILLLCVLLVWSLTSRANPSATEIVEHVENLLWGKTTQAQFEMTITTPSWSRSLTMDIWMDRPTKSFVHITAPAKDEGILSLRIGPEMWNYMPAVERTIKIPPSMMLQPWLGSDFTNDDMVKESSMVSDYTHRILAEKTVDGVDVYEVESLPKPEAAVVWGKVRMHVRKKDVMPLKSGFYDERGELVRTLVYSDEKKMDGRIIPTRWEMRPAANPGKYTTVTVKAARYDRPVRDDVFSLQNLRRKR